MSKKHWMCLLLVVGCNVESGDESKESSKHEVILRFNSESYPVGTYDAVSKEILLNENIKNFAPIEAVGIVLHNEQQMMPVPMSDVTVGMTAELTLGATYELSRVDTEGDRVAWGQLVIEKAALLTSELETINFTSYDPWCSESDHTNACDYWCSDRGGCWYYWQEYSYYDEWSGTCVTQYQSACMNDAFFY